MCFEIHASSVQSEFWIWRRDVVFRCIWDQLPTSNCSADWHLQASSGRLFTCQPFFFLLYVIYGQVLSETESSVAHWNLHNASQFTKTTWVRCQPQCKHTPTIQTVNTCHNRTREKKSRFNHINSFCFLFQMVYWRLFFVLLAICTK